MVSGRLRSDLLAELSEDLPIAIPPIAKKLNRGYSNILRDLRELERDGIVKQVDLNQDLKKGSRSPVKGWIRAAISSNQ